jgi:hypothetical protein
VEDRCLSGHPRDLNASIVRDATGEIPASEPDDGKDPAAVALARKGVLDNKVCSSKHLNRGEIVNRI